MRTADWGYITAVLLLAAGLRLIGGAHGAPDPQYSATDAAVRRLPLETPIHPDEYFFVAIPLEMAVRNYPNPKFFENPSFLINLNFVTYWLTGSADGIDPAARAGLNNRQYAPIAFYVIGRVYSALGGVFTVAVVYALARRLARYRLLAPRHDALIGTFAALLTAVSFTLVQHGHYSTPSSIAAAWVALVLWASIAALQRRRVPTGLFALAGTAAGFALTTRYNAGAVSLVVFVTGLLLWRRHRAWRTVLLGWLLFPAAFAFGSPGIVFDTEFFLGNFEYIFSQFLTTGAGFSDNYLTNAWLSLGFHLRYLALFSVGVPASFAALVGVWTLWQTRRARVVLLLIGVYLVPYALVVLRNIRPSYNDHMLVPIIPPIILLAGVGGAWLAGRTAAHSSHTLRARLTIPLVALLLVIGTIVPAVQTVRVLTQRDTRYQMQAWVYTHIERGSRVHLAAPYNVPLDPADYTWTQSFIDDFVTTDQLRADGVAYVIVSDAWGFDVWRSWEWMNPAFRQQVAGWYAHFDRDAVLIASIERPRWAGWDWLMHTAAYWHHPALRVYCLDTARCTPPAG